MDFFLVFLAFLWIFIASLQDLKKREVWNWLNFSLIAIAITYRAVFSILNNDIGFLLYGILGLGLFIVLGYVFYYSRVFAGGDAKLLFALGAIIPISGSVISNLLLMLGFILLLLFSGSLYGLAYSFVLVLINRKNFSLEFRKQFLVHRKLIYSFSIIAALLLLVPVVFEDYFLIVFSLIVFLLPLLFIYGKSIEQSCMIKEVFPRELTEGDWLYHQVKIGKKIIRPDWEGLTSKDLKILRKFRGKIKIKIGIPFVPAFFIAFLAFVFFYRSIMGFGGLF